MNGKTRFFPCIDISEVEPLPHFIKVFNNPVIDEGCPTVTVNKAVSVYTSDPDSTVIIDVIEIFLTDYNCVIFVAAVSNVDINYVYAGFVDNK